MGLDTIWSLRSRVDNIADIPIKQERNYYELRDWIVENCRPADEGGKWNEHYDFFVTYDDLLVLASQVEKYANIYSQFTTDELDLWCNHNEVPERFASLPIMRAHGNDFNPAFSSSFAAAVKLIQLWHFLEFMLDSIPDDTWKNYALIFHQSY